MGQTNSTQTFQTIIIESPIVQAPEPQAPQRKFFKANKKPNSNPVHTDKFTSSQSSLANEIEKSQQYKTQGNQFIQQKQYQQAIECYCQAINIYKGDSIYYSNRAVANKLLNRFSAAKQDAEAAIAIEESNARAHFIYGTICLIEVQMCPEISEQLIKQAHLGLKALDKAFQYLKDNNDEQKNKLKALINQNLGKGRRMVFLIAQEMDRRNTQTLKTLLADIASRNKQKLDWEFLNKQMNKNTLQDIPVPQHYTCIITFEMMNEPIHFNTGQTYEKKSIEQQFKQNGFIDPITRAEIDPHTARVNVQLLQGINEIRQKYGWVGIEHEDDYKSIKFE